MPTNKEALVKKLIAEGKTEAEAWAIANSTLDTDPVRKILWAKDRAVSFDSFIDERTGFMHVDAVIARTGIQKYLAYELGDEGNEIVGVFRSLEEVTHPTSIDSFTNIPVTDDHPTEMVTIDNHDKYAKGSISSINVIQLDDGVTALKTRLVITDKSLIEAIKTGKKELSAGYENILIAKDGNHDGEDYKYIQTDIRANHVAVVEAGRCGGVCKLMIDNSSMSEKNLNDEGEKPMIITIAGVEHDVPDEVAAEFERLVAVEAEMKKLEEETGEPVTEVAASMDKLTATVDSLTADKKALLLAKKDSKALINDAVAEKIDLLTVAKDAGIVCKTTDTALEIKQAIVTSYGMDTAGKTETYLDAAIDLRKQDAKDAAKRKDGAQVSYTKIGDEYKPSQTIDADAIGETEIK